MFGLSVVFVFVFGLSVLLVLLRGVISVATWSLDFFVCLSYLVLGSPAAFSGSSLLKVLLELDSSV